MAKKVRHLTLYAIICCLVFFISSCSTPNISETTETTDLVFSIDNREIKVNSVDDGFTTIGIREYEQLAEITKLERKKVYLPLHTLNSYQNVYFENFIYYITTIENSNQIGIYKYSIDTKVTTLIYSYTNDYYIDWILDLIITNNHIYWVEQTDNKNNWTLKQLCLEDLEMQVIRERPADALNFGLGISITASDDIVTWYEITDSTTHSLTGRVVVYNSKNNEMSIIEENAFLNTPHIRIPITNTKISFLKKHNEALSLYVYDFESGAKNEYKFNRNIAFGDISGMGNNIVAFNCVTGIGTDVYIFDYVNNKLMRKNAEFDNRSYFSNTYSIFQFFYERRNLSFIDLENKYIVNVDDDENEHNYYYPYNLNNQAIAVRFHTYDITKKGYAQEDYSGFVEGYYVFKVNN